MDAIGRLKKGNVDFLNTLDLTSWRHIIDIIKKRDDVDEIISINIDRLKCVNPLFLYELLSSMEKYEKTSYEVLFNNLPISYIRIDKLFNLLYKTGYGYDMVIKHFDYFMKLSNEFIECIIIYFIINNKPLDKIINYEDFNVRYVTMKCLLRHNKDLFDKHYINIDKYFKIKGNLMDEDKVSDIALECIKIDDLKMYKKIMNFIFKNYHNNSLAIRLIKDNKFIDTYGNTSKLFETSNNKLYIYENFVSRVSEDIINRFYQRIGRIYESYLPLKLRTIYEYGLGDLFEKYIDKYMSLSKGHEVSFIGHGTSSDCYRIGDYVIKLSDFKWSYADIICPDLYLIAKNYEEVMIRNSKGEVKAAIEVQKYLKEAKLDPKYYRYFERELKNLGYYTTDTLTKGECGENTMLLDSYLEADHLPLNVPEWFIKYPLVLVDRDQVYKIGSKALRNKM